ncbi:Similar to Arid2: AT-rich interactive domain-containing protein 2 (Mus musculus) [Cotesia congregata]|uniref:Similar to Arid2: AT-rich interactive domain-containing protein 2 (Mus musculus) n=1 Tax=Cotesia congregata TaxID=51543 RepID=A0A8J2E672_COTCN|nr:Similar to Arid2: AT-rich interactive domain-containing protein 2 (Mus musculus) [Cotesia congregata]
MAKILNKDPVTYERERLTFLKELHHFHETRGTGFKKYPKISGNEIDLYLLYLLVTAHGGWIKVHFLGEDGQQADDDDEDSRHRKWSARSLHSVPLTYNYHQHNVAESLREYNGLSSNLYKPSNYDKLALSLLSPLPNEQDFAINVCTLLSNEGKHTLRLDKYPRLINILLAHAGVFDSPGTRHLFIEVYSRVRNYSINSFWSDVLDSPQVLDLTDERTFMKKPTPTILNTFSRRKILDKNSKKAAGESKEKICEDKEQDKQEEDRDLFCMGRTLGTQDPYGQRVLQIASILRNLSFTPENAAVLGKNRCFLRFVLLCVRARWSNLHQLGFDILGNIANEIELKEVGERLAEGIINCIVHGIDSTDRFLALSDIALLVYTLECLYALTSLGERPCTSLARVRGAIDTLVALVTVEAQSYGPKACILMRVVETVSTLATSTVSQSTTTTTTTSVPTPVATTPAVVTTASIPAPVAAPVVSNISPVTSRPTTPATPAVKAAANKAIEAANSLQQQHAHQQIIQENEQFALGWLRATFELASGVKIEQEELYKKYLSSCTKIGRRGVIAPLHFPRCVRSVFGGTIGPNPQKGETTGTQYYEGIRVRATPAPITYPSQPSSPAVVTSASSTPTPAKVLQLVQQRTVTKSPAPDSTALDNNASKTITNSTATAQTPASPILKAHLSAPPKPTPSNATLNQPQIITKVDSKSQVSVTHPHLSQALLASGSAQNQPPLQGTVQAQAQTQTQTHMVQVVTKDGGTTSSSIIKSLLATKVTVSGDCMPSAAATCVSTSSNACVTNTTSIPTTISANQLITNNQMEVNDETVTSSTPSVIVSTENHIGQKVIRPPVTPKFITQKPYTPPVTEDSDSTNNSLASSSGIGRDCSGVAEEENSITSFEGILQNGVTPDLDQDSSSKESSVSSRGKQNLMLADLLERKVDKELVNGVLKNMENHVKKEVKLECGMSINDDAMIEAPIKRSSDSEESSVKKVKYSNGTSSWNENDSVNVESTVSSIKSEEDQEEKVTVSSTAANLYAALAADIIEDENDLEEPVKEEPKFSEQVVQQIVQVPQQVPQQLIVAAPRQIVVQNNQVLIPGQMKARTTQPQVLLQQGAGGQLQYVVSGGVPGQNYVLAQSQTALVQGQAQTVLVAQTTQQQGTGAKTIIILQPQAQGQGHQKVVAMTPQGQQVVVTQMPRPIIQSQVGNLPVVGNMPPLVPTSSGAQNSIIVNTSIVTQSNPNTVTVTIPAMTQQCPVTSSLPSRVVTPTPASTPPPTRPTTPHQAAATNVKLQNKLNKVTTSTSTEDKPSTSQGQSEKVVIKLDPNAFLCEWRGCLKQFKTAHEVYMHGCEAHCPNDAEEVVLSTATPAPSAAASAAATASHPGYAPNAALHAIKRHALEFINPKELMQQRPSKPAAAATTTVSSPRAGQNSTPEQDDNEGPVTKNQCRRQLSINN